MENSENQKGLLLRFARYLSERFPLHTYVLMILAFTFSAASYSRISRGATGFISLTDYLIGAAVTLGIFFIMRVEDEYKDQENDRKHRAYLPVPRGLISLGELQGIALLAGALVIGLVAFYMPSMWMIVGLIAFYLFLMRKEFFVAEWLKSKPLIYMFSHMVIIPLIDLFSSGLDWQNQGLPMHDGMWWFLAMSFFNGMVLEVGRKIRIKEDEEPGVASYSKAWGPKNATFFWISVLTITFSLAFVCLREVSAGMAYYLILSVVYGTSLISAIAFLSRPTSKSAKRIDAFAGVWTLAMYLLLGIVPMTQSLLI